MARHAALSTVEHRDLRVVTDRTGSLGDAVMCCVTFPDEFRDVQNAYPIVFQLGNDRETFSALALFGFEAGENLYLTAEGWEARYIPLAMDIQPFLIGRTRDPEAEKQIHIDLDSPRIGDDGVRVLDDDGAPTPYLEAINDKLARLDAGYQRAAAYLDFLKRHDLLEPFSLEVELDDGSQNRLVGFHTINEERLQALPDTVLAEMHAAGWLQPTYMAVASLSNLVGLIDRKNASLPHG